MALDDTWTLEQGHIVLSGTQAIARTLLDQARLDARSALETAGYITGYRGSPLGGLDSVLWSIKGHLQNAHVVFQPGVNEDIAATAVRGTQQIEAVPGPKYGGVFAAWYGKGPGVDRSGDAFKHGNYAGAHQRGGVLLFYGDDHAAKSSTVAHHSEQALAANSIPSLYPSDVGEIRRFGLLGFAMSRYSGSWIGIKCVTEVVEQTSTVDIDLSAFEVVLPPIAAERAAIKGLHGGHGVFDPLNEERIVVEERLPLVQAFVRANGIDRAAWQATRRRVGIVTAGKTYGDVRSALYLLGLDEEVCRAVGISLYKIGCIWPVEPQGLREFAAGHAGLFVIEEKAPFLELQIASILVNDAARPWVIGKTDQDGSNLLSSVRPLESEDIASALELVLQRQGISIPRPLAPVSRALLGTHKRSPYFCSGCPHNRSTRVPSGSLSMTGIGCHTMVNFVRPKEALLPTQMGGEGCNWLGLAPFTHTKHIFQNIGDGTYYHSGLLAIRAAVAARVNITYKILYNDAVAMTGGQPVDGPLSVGAVVQQVLHEGVTRVVIVSDDPARHRRDTSIPKTVDILPRVELDAVQRSLRDTLGCTVLVYEQECATEKRRRRKRGLIADPAKRVFIAADVCEGCGDCSEISTCVSIIPRETALGRKRAIDQSSCNKDFSCSEGFCPSFITVHGGESRSQRRPVLDDALFTGLPPAPVAPISERSFNIMIAGIGGTGVVTVGAVIGMAAHLDGLAMSVFDMTGVSQKNGAVFSHLRIARNSRDLTGARLSLGEADTLLAFDFVAALAAESARSLSPSRTKSVANADLVPGVEFQFNGDIELDSERLASAAQLRIAPEALICVNASRMAQKLLGDAIGANMLLVGVAAQAGLLPVSAGALQRAIELTGIAVQFNLNAFRLGRLLVTAPAQVRALQGIEAASVARVDTLEELIQQRAAHLECYQGRALRDRFLSLVSQVKSADAEQRLTAAVARNYAKLLAYKDEYEVARLLTKPELFAELKENFGAGARFEFNLAPPTLAWGGHEGRPRKRRFPAAIVPFLRVLASLRGLRGTWLDPFGYTRERKAERAMIKEYEQLIGRVLADLNVGNYERGVEILELADGIRGYGPVKEASLARYRLELERLLHPATSSGTSTRSGRQQSLSSETSQ